MPLMFLLMIASSDDVMKAASNACASSGELVLGIESRLMVIQMFQNKSVTTADGQLECMRRRQFLARCEEYLAIG